MATPLDFNPFTRKLDIAGFYRGVQASAPVGAQTGWIYVDSTDHKIYIYYGNSWQVLHVLFPGVFYPLLLESDSDETEYLLLESDTDGSSYLAVEA
jgi:hypothetical protein